MAVNRNPWESIWTSAQKRSAYFAFVVALGIETLLVFQNLPPATPFFALQPVDVLRELPMTGALASTIACGLSLWPPLFSLFSGAARWPAFVRGAFIGVLTLVAAACFTHFGFTAFAMATMPNAEWGFVLGPVYFISYLTLLRTWLALVASAVIGGFAAAFSEAVW